MKISELTLAEATAERDDVQSTAKKINRAVWAVAIGVAIYGAVNVTLLLIDHDVPIGIAPLLSLMVDAALCIALWAGRTLSRYGKKAGWLTMLRNISAVLTLALNAAGPALHWEQPSKNGPAVWAPDWVSVGIHSVGPILLWAVAEGAGHILLEFGRIVAELDDRIIELHAQEKADETAETTTAGLAERARATEGFAPAMTPATAPVPAAGAPAPGTADQSRPADLYRLSFTDGHRESDPGVPAATPGRTESWPPRTVPDGWSTPVPAPRPESSTETPTRITGSSAENTPGGTESGSGSAREPAESTETPTGSSRENDEQTRTGIDYTEADKQSSSDESGTAEAAASGDQDTELTPTERARAHWDAERAAGRTPSGAELDRIAGTKDYGRGLRRKWLADEAEAEGRLHAV